MESAVNTITPSEETVAKLQPLASGASPLALEIAVNVAGARPASASGQRDLFSEDTSTVLISENGAVIRLAAAVVTGQLLFLTDKRSNSEMVCQVVRKRAFRPTECYVELEFTEPAPNFWGLEIPAKPPSPAQTETAQSVESAETTVDDVPPEAPAAQGQGVAELKQEVESLREQIRSLPQTKAEAAKAEAEAALQQSAKRAEAAAAEQSRIKPVAAPTPPPVAPPPPPPPPNPPAVASALTDGKVPETAAEAAPDVAAKPLVRMALPRMIPVKEAGANDSGALDPLDCLLPKPNLDFSAAPAPGAANERRSLYDIHKPMRVGIGKFRLALLIGVLLGAVLSGAWYIDWLPLPSLGGITQMIRPANSKKMEKGAAQHAAPAIASRTAATPNAASPDAVTPEPADETSPQPASGAVEPADVPNPEALAPAASAPAGPAAPKVKNTVASATSPERASAKEKDGSAGSLRKNVPTATPSATAAAAPPEPVARDAVLVPPKLLKSASPVYPPNAMRQYITGDVRVDALVEPDGRIGAMKILGGPVPLRQAAMDALKQYEYAPATQGGRAVAAHITVTVKFWFNP